jgi:hypothetical protein
MLYAVPAALPWRMLLAGAACSAVVAVHGSQVTYAVEDREPPFLREEVARLLEH